MKKCNNCKSKEFDNAQVCSRCGGNVFTPLKNKPRFIVCLAKVLCYIAAWVALQLAVSFIYLFVLGFCLALRQNGPLSEAETQRIIQNFSAAWLENINMLSLLSSALFVVLLMLFFAARKRNFFNEARIASVTFKTIPLCVVLGVSANVVVNTIISIIPWPSSFVEQINSSNGPIMSEGSFITQILSVCVMTGIVEELIFRGLLISRLRRSAGSAVCVFFSAAIFALAHAGSSPIAISYSFFIGLIFAAIFVKYDSIIPTAICHAFFNFTSLITAANVERIGINLAAAIIFACLALFIASLYLLLKKDRNVSDNL